ncbi:hypothetical protein [Homoserinimonas sp. A520]
MMKFFAPRWGALFAICALTSAHPLALFDSWMLEAAGRQSGKASDLESVKGRHRLFSTSDDGMTSLIALEPFDASLKVTDVFHKFPESIDEIRPSPIVKTLVVKRLLEVGKCTFERIVELGNRHARTLSAVKSWR